VFVQQIQIAFALAGVDPEFTLDVADAGRELLGAVVAENAGHGRVGAEEHSVRGRLGDALQGVVENGAVAGFAPAQGVFGVAPAGHVLEGARDDAHGPGVVGFEFGADMGHPGGVGPGRETDLDAEGAPGDRADAQLAQEAGPAVGFQEFQEMGQ
jgi:hypothetical protein